MSFILVYISFVGFNCNFVFILYNEQIKREKAIKRKEALELAKKEEEEARLAEVEGLVDLLQKEPGPFR